MLNKYSYLLVVYTQTLYCYISHFYITLHHNIMETKENPASSFSTWDYVVFALMLVISAAIGVYYAFAQRQQQTARDFLVGGQSMTAVPIALSLTASFMSAITVLATPVEVYCNGAIFVLSCLGFVLMVAISSEVFLPIFYRLGITSTYEVRYFLAEPLEVFCHRRRFPLKFLFFEDLILLHFIISFVLLK